MESNVSFDETKTYRYALERNWDETKGRVLFIMLNPSSADDMSEDRTSKRCLDFAKTLGYGSLEIVNLFAYIATDRKQLLAVEKEVAIGPENENYVIRALNRADMILAAWGENCKYHRRDKDIQALFGGYHIHCLGKTRQGFPRHPLYLSRDTQPIDYMKPEKVVRHLVRTAKNRPFTSREGMLRKKNGEMGGDFWMWCEICHSDHPVAGKTVCQTCSEELKNN